MLARLPSLLSALGFAAAASLAPSVVHPWPVADATAFALAVLAVVMGVQAIDAPSR